ncbi:tetratricopeptide repeat protein [Paenibacillus sp. TRM 82003]|nr:tetratricopeptide repeat protein [Paenibacillus sp. TRM 82003]
MFKHLFQSMNEKLDDIIEALPTSQGAKKETLLSQLKELRDMSDTFIEEWLLFEEKMAKAKERPAETKAPNSSEVSSFFDEAWTVDAPDETLQYQRGEGYFKLFMFAEATREFEAVLDTNPDYLPARLYLALCYLQSEKIVEAYSQLQIIIALAEDGKTKAVAYNALGCVQAMKGDVEKACECFRTSQSLDPNFKDPVYNLKACQIDGGVLQLGVAIG